ncbi:hypothetical protein [Neobacillus niacini]|uniref:hypothetical protein n=1 Tax=Neobacillus niacini TaxID=86668 RepID=UPI0039839457
MNISLQSSLSVVQIQIRKDKKNYIVEDLASGDFYEMPEICIEAIQLMDKGITLGEIEETLKKRFPLEEVNLLDFSQQLLDLDLIEAIDGEKVMRKEQGKERLGFLWISQKTGKIFFNKMTIPLYISLFIANLFLLLTNPYLFPRYQDVFISNIMAVNIIAYLGVTFTLVLIHEFGHILAMRAYNLPTKLEVGHRLFLVVLETDMASVWSLPSKDRNVLYMAGLCFDNVVLFAALLGKMIFPNLSGIFLALISLAVYDVFIRVVYQCCVYMKTDLYYVFENVTGYYNLMENAKWKIRNKLPFLKSKTTKDEVFKGEKYIVFGYSIFYLIGVTVSLLLITIFYLPVLFYGIELALPNLLESPSSFLFWDALLFFAQFFLILILLLRSWRKKYLKT